MKKSLIIIGLAVSVTALNGCSTARGFGQDLEDLGRIIQGENAKNYEVNRSKSTASTSNYSDTASVSTTTSYAYVEPSTTTQSTSYVTSGPAADSIPMATTYPYPSGTTSSTVAPSVGISSHANYQ